MIEIEIDGQKVEVAPGSMVMDAANKLGLYVPHFCYHKKLSIAANCRMCLVEVEKAPKPLPACATPVAAGMKVMTASPKARAAQKGVMEFLLINHPLDCPICDQGGECQLQDLAVGYGPSASRFTEEKRVVFHKPMGPLISAEEMSRCIHCTRCVRFGQEIAGVMELGMANRGEHSEIMSFVGSAIESELSGNMIDVCPVGALTSKPFRYQARTWELARRRSVSPHDALGANLVVQAKSGSVVRVVPQENEAVNECWISDRDRFAYEGLRSDDRLTTPMVRDTNGQWRETDWDEALNRAADILRAASDVGPNRVRALAAPMATVEELALLARVARGLRSDSIDCRPGLSQSALDADISGVMHLGFPVEELSELERCFVVGGLLRADLPLVAQRLRQAVRRQGAELSTLHACAEDLLTTTHTQMVVKPSGWSDAILEVISAVAQQRSVPMPAGLPMTTPSEAAQAIAASLCSAPSGSKAARILAGAQVIEHPQAGLIMARLQVLADLLEVRLGVLVPGANVVGGTLAGAIPQAGGANAADMLTDSAAAFLLLHLEPALDAADGPRAVANLRAAAMNGLGVVALTAYRSAVADVANVMLPIAPFTETSGSFVNLGGRLQSFEAAVRPQGSVRPGWKVLRVLGNLLNLEGFDAMSSEDVLRQVMPGAVSGERLPGLSFRVVASPIQRDARRPTSIAEGQLERLGPVPIYLSDPIVRRAASLSSTRQSAFPKAYLHPTDLREQGLAPGMPVTIEQDGYALSTTVEPDPKLCPGVLRLASAHPQAAQLSQRSGSVRIRPQGAA
ncbi:MAG: dehydrogenase subunit [Pseudomonadota bacterium]